MVSHVTKYYYVLCSLLQNTYTLHVAALLSNISNKNIQQTHIITYFYLPIYQIETYFKKFVKYNMV